MTIYPSKLSGTISAPPSKSMAHRAIICAALARGESRVSNVELSEDIAATIGAVRALGAEVVIQGDGRIKLLNITGMPDKPADMMPEIDCGESGSTLRFMIPVALATAGMAMFTGRGTLLKRPIDTYRGVLEAKDTNWAQVGLSLPLEVKGRLKSGIYELPGNVSSQYISGLLFALPMLDGSSEIKITGKFESKKYVDMTIQILKIFGIGATETGSGYSVQGNQAYAPARYRVEGDWSQAAFLAAAGALGGGVKISGLLKDSLQGDKAIAGILAEMGADISWQGEVLDVKKSPLKAVKADVSQCPDLTPAIALLMSCAEGKSRITGGARLKIKESDRIMSVANALNSLGAKVTPTDDGMAIEGAKALSGGAADAMGDHRIAMMAAVASAKCKDEIELTGKDSVNKSYPSFWEDFVILGGKIK